MPPGRLSRLEGVLLLKSSLCLSFALLVFLLVLKRKRAHVFPWSNQDGRELKNWSWIRIPLPRLLNGMLMHGVMAKSQMDRTSSRRCFVDCRHVKIGVDMGPDPFECRLDKLSIES
jgi:hypothetical protein